MIKKFERQMTDEWFHVNETSFIIEKWKYIELT